MMAKRKTFTDALRQAVRDCGLQQRAMARAARIDEAHLSRFLSGQTALSMRSFDRLADVVGLEVVACPSRRRR